MYKPELADVSVEVLAAVECFFNVAMAFGLGFTKAFCGAAVFIGVSFGGGGSLSLLCILTGLNMLFDLESDFLTPSEMAVALDRGPWLRLTSGFLLLSCDLKTAATVAVALGLTGGNFLLVFVSASVSESV